MSAVGAIRCAQCNTEKNGVNCAGRPPPPTECPKPAEDHCATVVRFIGSGESIVIKITIKMVVIIIMIIMIIILILLIMIII